MEGQAISRDSVVAFDDRHGRGACKTRRVSDGGGLVVGGENPTYVQVLADGGESTVKLVNKTGERVIKP